VVNLYECFYMEKRTTLPADTSYEAQRAAVAYFKPSKRNRHMVHVHLVQRSDGSTVIHTAT
jgi:hypothetical protein